MDLYILRHAKAVPRGDGSGTGDAERVLTPEGIAKMEVIAHGIERMDLRFERILTSPYVRARQTAEIADRAAGGVGKGVEVTPQLVPGGDQRALVEGLSRRRPACESVLLVGHEPDLSRLISVLTAGVDTLRLNLKKGGLALVRTGRLRYGACGSLEWVLTPRQLVLLAKA